MVMMVCDCDGGVVKYDGNGDCDVMVKMVVTVQSGDGDCDLMVVLMAMTVMVALMAMAVTVMMLCW